MVLNENQEDEEKTSKPNLVLGFDKLLEPTLELLGKEIRDFIKGKLDNWKEKKRSENIQGHVQKALSGPDSEFITKKREKKEAVLTDATKLEEWMKGAENVDPDEPILGKMWQGMLKKVLQGDGPEEYLIKKMQSLSRKEALLLLLLKKKGARFPLDMMIPETDIPEKDRLYLDMLKDKGLVEKNYIKGIVYPAIFAVSAIIVFQTILEFYLIEPTISGREFLIAGVIGLLSFIFSFAVFGFGRYRLSEIGRELVRYAPDIDIHKIIENEKREEANNRLNMGG